jgi:hypothetical protein
MILKRKRFVWKLNLCWKKLKSKNFGQNFILVRQNFLVGIFFWSENNFGQNFFWFKQFVGWREKNCWSENNFGRKFCWLEKFVGLEMS